MTDHADMPPDLVGLHGYDTDTLLRLYDLGRQGRDRAPHERERSERLCRAVVSILGRRGVAV